MRTLLVVLWLLLAGITPATASVQVFIGINLPVYPQLVRVPGYPVYYAPRVAGNFFFYDGLYWVFYDDDWYVSSWYNGPWTLVAPLAVPVFILRIPVRYYRDPPIYFRTWRREAPPRWREHWGDDWAEHRRGWDRWDRRAAPPPAPLPIYQRRYSGDRYPRDIHEQRNLSGEHYRYRPRDATAREFLPPPAPPRMRGPDREEREATRRERPPRTIEQDRPRSAPDAPVQRRTERMQPEPRQMEPRQREPRQMEPRRMEPAREQRMQERHMRDRQMGGPRMDERAPQDRGGGAQPHGRKQPQQEEERGRRGRNEQQMER
ncbi:hypothetical protein [Aromatoleum evansii]|uniref:hypothetical protein n=1 Tax=Aromatoleum evansii TaxID=59406 RepID=UPI00145DB4BE|nr:hypothetical protein [Aromatoleum evansii]NMG28458.1 hypothetical protein [Aromatoleum evansii]